MNDPRRWTASELTRDVIRMMTGNSARHSFTPDDYGVIAPGMLADLIVLDGDPLEDLTAATRPVVVKGGEIVIDKRQPGD